MEKKLDYFAFFVIILTIIINIWNHEVLAAFGWLVAFMWCAKYLSVKEY